MSSQQKLQNVIDALDKVPLETKQMIYDMSQNMTEKEIIQSFNQQTIDLLTLLIQITQKTKLDNKYKLSGYKVLFENAIKLNWKLPIDRFTLSILEFASDIYAENEDCFLNMTIPDAKIETGTEFNLIRSEMFKNLWRELDNNDKEQLKEKIIILTTFAHAYLYKSL